MTRLMDKALPVACLVNVAAALWVHNIPAATGWAIATIYTLRAAL